MSGRVGRLLGLFALAALAVGLRLAFAASRLHPEPVLDAALYWQGAAEVREALFSANASVGTLLPDFLRRVALGHQGLLPAVIGLLTGLFGARIEVAHYLFALLDALCALMVVHMARRLSLPVWAALFAGALTAVHIPAVIGCAALLQQPFLRFTLTATMWAYTLAFTSRRRQALWAWIGTAACLGVAFSTLMTRPLLWVVPVLALAAAGRKGVGGPLFRAQLLASLASICLLGTAVGLAGGGSVPLAADRARLLFTGLPRAGEVSYTVSILSFAGYWPPDDPLVFRDAAHASVPGAAATEPMAFVSRLSRSVFDNWRYPDRVYGSEFLLGRRGQEIQHLLLVYAGIAGLAWLAGQQGARFQVATLAFGLLAYSSLVYAAVSVEPRRLAPLTPLLSLGAGAAFACFAPLAGAVCRSRVFQGGVALLVMGAGLAEDRVVDLMPIPAQAVYWAAVLGGTVGAFLVVISFARASRAALPAFRPAVPLSIAATLLLFVGWRKALDPEWGAYSVRTEDTLQVRQAGLPSAEGWPWLLVDVGTPDEAKALAIRADGTALKDCGTAMWSWQPGTPLMWPVYDVLLERADPRMGPRPWMAYPVPPEFARKSTVVIEIEPCDGPATFFGDRVGLDGSVWSPALEPWQTSVWRWLWNGRDARIPRGTMARTLSDTALVGREDGRPRRGEGRLRAQLALMPFALPTNVASRPPRPSGAKASCPRGVVLSGLDEVGLLVCRGNQGVVRFYGPGKSMLGALPPSVLTPGPPSAKGGRVGSEAGSVELVAVSPGMVLARFCAPGGPPIGAVAFAPREAR